MRPDYCCCYDSDICSEVKILRLAIASVICFVIAGALQALGFIQTLKGWCMRRRLVAPVWNIHPVVNMFLAKATRKGIEEVTRHDGMAAALVVAGVLVLG